MIRKYHNHKLQTTPWHREEDTSCHMRKIYLLLKRYSKRRHHSLHHLTLFSTLNVNSQKKKRF